MAKKSRKFGELSKTARERATRTGKREYGLTARQVRERYNRGTYNPFARGDPRERVPVEWRPYVGEDGKVIWQDAALDNIRIHLSDYYKYIDDSVVYYTEHANDTVARIMAMATEDELVQWAKPQPDSEGNPPSIDTWVGLPSGLTLNDVGVYVHGEWNNIFWYH